MWRYTPVLNVCVQLLLSCFLGAVAARAGVVPPAPARARPSCSTSLSLSTCAAGWRSASTFATARSTPSSGCSSRSARSRSLPPPPRSSPPARDSRTPSPPPSLVPHRRPWRPHPRLATLRNLAEPILVLHHRRRPPRPHRSPWRRKTRLQTRPPSCHLELHLPAPGDPPPPGNARRRAAPEPEPDVPPLAARTLARLAKNPVLWGIASGVVLSITRAGAWLDAPSQPPTSASQNAALAEATARSFGATVTPLGMFVTGAWMAHQGTGLTGTPEMTQTSGTSPSGHVPSARPLDFVSVARPPGIDPPPSRPGPGPGSPGGFVSIPSGVLPVRVVCETDRRTRGDVRVIARDRCVIAGRGHRCYAHRESPVSVASVVLTEKHGALPTSSPHKSSAASCASSPRRWRGAQRYARECSDRARVRRRRRRGRASGGAPTPREDRSRFTHVRRQRVVNTFRRMSPPRTLICFLATTMTETTNRTLMASPSFRLISSSDVPASRRLERTPLHLE